MAGIVNTIRSRCKRCYNCVSSCPAKAIKVENGQAQVIQERCIACGNCYKVCAQQAKEVQSGIRRAWDALQGREPIVALLAPSFPAAFPDVTPGQVVNSLRALGFDEVLEVAFGAQLVSREYARLFADKSRPLTIATPCPAVTAYIQKYEPSLVPHLAPIVSPAVALGRAVKTTYLPGARTVFIGPCVAKKAEAADPQVGGFIDVCLTYVELQKMFARAAVDPHDEDETCFDGPMAGLARIFPVSGGLLRAAALEQDILENEIIVTEGKENTINVLRALATGELKARFVDVLFCNGCIDGPALEARTSLFARKEAVANYVRQRCEARLNPEVEAALDEFAGVDLSRTFAAMPFVPPQASEAELTQILERIGKARPGDQLNCGACGYPTCREKAIAVYEGLAEVEMCLPYLIEQLQSNLQQVEHYQRELQETQAQLVHSEKLASVGQLAAGIAHELNNPLGSILIYSHLLLKDFSPQTPQHQDVRLILEETTRCKAIVAGLLDFARQREIYTEATDVNALLEDMLASALKHDIFASTQVERKFDPALPEILADPNQLREVFWNLAVNAAQAMPHGGRLTIATRLADGAQAVEIAFSDEGVGIPPDELNKVFTPFFTTKSTGTGLGLSIVYGIVKMHRGNITVSSEVGRGATFVVTLPIRHEARLGDETAKEKEQWEPYAARPNSALGEQAR
ncbi:MAG: [Fe-Fe] hydrogenase large subunit C-terminal domain-containing protein [Chloroflexota bacterium]